MIIIKDINKTVCSNLKRMIVIRGITQQEAANISGYSLPTISRYLNGRTDYNIRILNDIVISLGFDFEELFFAVGEDKMTIDLESMQEKEPELYNEFLKDYPKTIKGKSAFIRFDIK